MNEYAWLRFVLPPLIGAVIGLFTNWLAIKMLFRPLKAYRVLGVRVPFTPGILPREREGIAKSLGDTVSKDLLTEEVVGSRLRSQEFKHGLESALCQAGTHLLDARPEQLGEGFSPELGSALKDAGHTLLGSITGSDAFRMATDAALAVAIRELGPLSLGDLAKTPGKLPAAVGMRPEFKDALSKAVANALMACLDAARANGGSLSAILPKVALVSLSAKAANASYPALSQAIAGVLTDPAIRTNLEKAGARLVRSTLERFSAFQRFFITLGRYDEAILEKMPETIADFTSAVQGILDDESTRKAAVSHVAAAVEGILDKPLDQWKAFSSPEALAQSAAKLQAMIRSALDTPPPPASPLKAVLGCVRVDTVLGAFPGIQEALSRSAAAWLASVLAPGDDAAPAAKMLSSIAASFADAFARGASGHSLAELSGLDDAWVRRVAGAASGGLADLAARESGAILKSLDVRNVVVNKVNSLELIEVERMLLRVIDRELRAVTWFGGVLGLLIGGSQSLVALFW